METSKSGLLTKGTWASPNAVFIVGVKTDAEESYGAVVLAEPL